MFEKTRNEKKNFLPMSVAFTSCMDLEKKIRLKVESFFIVMLQ